MRPKSEVRNQKAECRSQDTGLAVKPKELVAEIRREFEKAADAKYRESIQRFFKEPIDFYGVRTPEVRRIHREYFDRVKHLPKSEILEICELLHKGTKYEEHGIAFSWAGRLVKKLEPSDFAVLERWLKLYVSNWAACDTFCGGAVGEFLLRFQQFLPCVRAWASSKNRWLRRASAVALILAAKQERYLHEAYATADILLLDEDDMVQKGYGWLLKEIANKRPQEVFDFVLERRDRMPRTALRYAIEKMPAAWKKRAMAK
ncbi:DNA alkylation repair protein [candidate division WOR-3 bacterium]|uniref:DNA alkylation repair protein n=1 Tax=candidate division WOR-3 bacterium TaxID=2052148 RepID=A0A938BPW8_UNCW3|nr:DNA alkylation repair protein [candidate division WOR-3 bacterium]